MHVMSPFLLNPSTDPTPLLIFCISKLQFVMTTAISAPGKVLLAGGYLVLDRAYTGLVFGLNARIHIVVQDSKAVSDDTFSEIVVRSPQFRDAVWTYNIYQAAEDSGIQVVQQKGYTL